VISVKKLENNRQILYVEVANVGEQASMADLLGLRRCAGLRLWGK
jgi:hypothetical protein